MPAPMPSREEILDLSRKLRNESLQSEQEREALRSLNKEVDAERIRLHQQSWIFCQQQLNLYGLIYATQGLNTEPSGACKRANALQSVKVIEAYKQVASNQALLSDLFRILTNHPRLLAELLYFGENFEGSTMQVSVL